MQFYSCTCISSLMPIIRISTLLGLTPNYNFKTYKSTFRNCFKLYSLCLVFILCVLTAYCFFIRLTVLYDDHFSFSFLIDSLWGICALYTGVVTTLGASFWNGDNWNAFFIQLCFLNGKRNIYGARLEPRLFSKQSVLFYIGSTYIFVLAASQCILYELTIFLAELACDYLQFVCVFLAFNLVLLIKSKFKNIQHHLDTGLSSDIRRAREFYMATYEVIILFNRIFGWTFFGIFAGLLCNILLGLISLTFGFQDFKFVQMFTSLYLAQVSFGPITLLFCCDATVAESANLLTQCYKLHQWVPLDSREDKELVRLEDLIKSKPVIFTAAGFFQINKSTLSYLLSSITTYFIVAIQFKDK